MFGDALEHRARQAAQQRALEVVAQRELDLAGIGRQFHEVPIAVEAAERAPLEGDGHEVGAALGVARGEVEADIPVVDVDVGDDDAVVALEIVAPTHQGRNAG